jgi:hypothetical protein
MNAVYRDFRFSSARRDKTLGSCRRLLDEIKLKAEERLFVPDQKIRTALKSIFCGNRVLFIQQIDHGAALIPELVNFRRMQPKRKLLTSRLLSWPLFTK